MSFSPVSESSLRSIALGTGVVAIILGGIMWLSADLKPKGPVPVIAPELSAAAAAGKQAFDRSCAQCHGENAAGTPSGPPLVHRVYAPRLHGDAAFELAVKRGVRAHHWSFGDMPPQPAVTTAELAAITGYVRDLQKTNGIE